MVSLWLALSLIVSAVSSGEGPRASLWIDLCAGEPLRYEEMLEDLAGVRVVYLGERHSVARHHELQARIVADLARNSPLVLGLEQIESPQQTELDRYAKGELSFEQFAEVIQWDKRWRGCAAYKPAMEAARRAGAPIRALNARSETIRQVVRSGGVAKLAPALRKELPAEMQLEDYAHLLGMQMMVHAAATPDRLRPMIEAQIARDETMAWNLATFLKSAAGEKRTAVVLCGAGHVAYGLGTAARVRRLIPGVKERIVLFSESGDVQLSPEEQAAARPITITHEQLRSIERPVADYLHAIERK